MIEYPLTEKDDYVKGTVVRVDGGKWVVVASKKDLEDRYAREGQPAKNLSGLAVSPFEYYQRNMLLSIQQIHEDLLNNSMRYHGKGIRYKTIHRMTPIGMIEGIQNKELSHVLDKWEE